MEDFNHFTSFNGGNNENELNPQMASKLKKQSPSKSFMNPIISAANKTTFPKKKILAEQNQTLDVVQQTNIDPKAANFPVVEANLQPYDPIKNYLSPRPKFLRYNPDRRRKMIGFQENDKSSSSSSSFDSGITSFGLELSQDSCGSTDSCSQKESVEEAMDMIEKKDSCSQESVEEPMDVIRKNGEEEEEDEIEEEMVEFGEEKGCGFKGFLKFLVVVIALISTTQAICSMNSHPPPRFSQSREFLWGFNDWYGKGWNYVHGVQGSNFLGGLVQNHTFIMPENGPDPDGVGGLSFSKVGDPIRESGVEAEIEVLDQDFDQNFVIEEEEEEQLVEVVEIDNVEAEIEVLDQDFVIEEEEEKLVEVVEIDHFEAEIEEVLDQDFNQDFDIKEEEQLDANSKNTQLTIDDMEEGIEEIHEQETTVFLIRFAGFDLIAAVLIGVSILIFGVIYHSKLAKTKPSSPIVADEKNNLVAKNQDFKKSEPAPPVVNSASLVRNPTPENISSGVQAPTVELLGEFVFEVTNSSFRSNETTDYTTATLAAESRRPATVSSSQTRSSVQNTVEKTVKKLRRKNAEVTPSPVRRSTRIQNRPAVMSP